MSIVAGLGGNPDPRIAQGTKSEHLKFKVPLCQICNTARTQASDKAFDWFHEEMSTIYAGGGRLGNVFDHAKMMKGRETYEAVFRFFAKQLVCQLADAGAPILVTVASYAIGVLKFNRVNLAIVESPKYAALMDSQGPVNFAAHGGLVVLAGRRLRLPVEFHLSLTVVSIKYNFYVRTHWLERLEIVMLFPRYAKFVRDRTRLGSEFLLTADDAQNL